MKIRRHGFSITFVALALLATLAFTQQAHAAATTTDSIGAFTFSQNRQLWERGEDIRSLQKLLNAQGLMRVTRAMAANETDRLYVAHFNLCRVHEAHRQTPAMAIGVANHVWSIGELIDAA